MIKTNKNTRPVSEIHDEDILSGIETALSEDQFRIVYQPKFDLVTLKTVGAESLIRWYLPDGRQISPDRFIPVLEKSGHVIELDFLVLEKTCRMLQRTIEKGLSPVPVSVNFSRVHIYREDFIERLHRTVTSFGIPSGLIEIEFTETAFIDDNPPLDQLIDQLHALGYRVAMDDFGTGFSSLNELMNLQVDVLKLDRGFLKITNRNRERAQCIIQSLIQMAKTLNMQVVAEGVEDMKALSLLKECGCLTGQGYYYSRPVPEIHYLKLLPPRSTAV